MSDLTATTTIGDFFSAVRSRISTQTGVAANRVFVVDKLRLQDSAVPNYQIEPVSLSPLSESTGANVCVIEYRVHAVVRVDYEMEDRMTERLVDNKSSFLLLNSAVGYLVSMVDTTSYSRQIFIRMDGGTHDDGVGLTSSTATFRCHVRTISDG